MPLNCKLLVDESRNRLHTVLTQEPDLNRPVGSINLPRQGSAMRPDAYGPQLLDLFNTTAEALTSAEAASLIGCSKQRSYAWIDKNRNLLVSKGRGKYGGVAYIGKQNPMAGARGRTSVLKGATGTIEVGMQFEVLGITVQGGRVIVAMVDEHGGTVRFQVADDAS